MLRASASSLRFTPIYGGASSAGSAAPPSLAPFAYLFEVDGVRILLDCGWNDSFDVEYLEKLKPYLSTVHAVLLSTPEMVSCGCLPYVMEHLPPGAFVAAAGSTSKMGIHGVLHPFLYQHANTADFNLSDGECFTMTVDKVYSAFRSVRDPYGGKVVVKHKDITVECHAVFSGRMLGGYGWLIKHQIDEVFYCPDFSMKPSYALKRFVVPTTANVLCIEAFPMQHVLSPAGHKYEDQLENLFRDMQRTLRGGSDVLFPVNAAGRGLEILNTIVCLLEERGSDKYKVVLAALQARELIDKAATMTEALKDDVTLREQALFSNVITCRTSEEVVNIAGPKVVIADGASLEYGIAAELLPYFLPTNSQGSENLLVLTEDPQPGSNAQLIAESTQHEEILYSVVKRLRLNKEELEEYYLQQEHEMEERRKQLEEQDTRYMVQGAVNNETDDEDMEDEDVPAAATADAAAAKHKNKKDSTKDRNTPGLVLPPYMKFFSKHLQFPVLEGGNTLIGCALKGENVAYGLRVSDEEQVILRKRAPVKNRSDEGPEALITRNDAQNEANIPSKIFRVQQTCPRNCKIVRSDLSGLPDAATMKTLLKTKFSFAKKIVAIRGTADEWRLMAQYCRNERSMKCGESVFMPQGPGVPLELATQVFSYIVQLDSDLAQQLPHSLRRVRETNSNGTWEVTWINGELRASLHSGEPDVRKMRFEEGTQLTLGALAGPKIQQCASEREARGLQSGSFFLGDMDLNRLQEGAKQERGLSSDFHKKSPMLVFDDGVCVRKGSDGTITVSSMVGSAMFDIRRSVYSQYEQTL